MHDVKVMGILVSSIRFLRSFISTVNTIYRDRCFALPLAVVEDESNPGFWTNYGNPVVEGIDLIGTIFFTILLTVKCVFSDRFFWCIRNHAVD
jgi:hypothetical protein